MNKINLGKNIQSANHIVAKLVEQCRQNIFFLAHLGCSQWDEVETRSNKYK
ncbi:hypothetical protein K8B83_05375 [Shewanella inventionis]|uniref:Uncharacterized protein n=1 Tax=Shewanella inventionis TaxID=1738770 RepID=A0ABQ1INJ0_9GAMM|nr:hypothetical protein [Shewanella inventionis]MCL1156586.1 hypothetical protein [Shewanella inventionis]UAL44278.1 hypothetical protein K8B83_05375 [Shewanella inventionis]GGB46642.1 hypothetical protein GCM10011607_03530 [Shewanella inventionis]